MAIITNTFTSFDAIGIREELANIIYDISPDEAPFQANVGQEEVHNTYYEWLTDVLAGVDTSLAIPLSHLPFVLETAQISHARLLSLLTTCSSRISLVEILK